MTFRNRLMLLGALGPIAAVLVGIVALFSQWQLQTVMEQNITLGVAIRNHVEGDMMHDGIRADALAALLAANTGKGDEAQIRQDTKDHSEWFLRLIDENSQLKLSADNHQAIAEVKPALEAYIEQAQNLVDAAFKKSASVDADLAAFEKAFEDLEVRNEKVSDQLTDSLKNSQKTLDSWLNLSKLLIALIVIAVVIVVFIYGSMIGRRIATIIGGELEEALEHTFKMASGDLNVEVNIKSGDTTSMLAGIAQMRGNLTKMLRETQQKLAAVVPELTNTAERTRHDMQRQVNETVEVLSATSQLAEASQEVARSAANAAGASQDANHRAKQGQLTVNDAMHSNRELASHMGNAADVVMRLDEGSRQITTIVEVIRTIAEQTNLLALNAAIEAARAGEQGRGFAVVADEVRTLAQRTQTATQEIGEIITRLTDASQRAVDAIRKGEGLAEVSVEKVNHVGNLLDTIVEAIAVIDSMNAQIASASEEQNAVAQGISGNLENLSHRARDTSTAADQTMHAVTEMHGVVQQLDVMVNGGRR